MKKIINGKLYNTETAELIFEKEWYDTSVNYRQKEFYYKKKTGEFFRHDEKRTTYGWIYNYEKIQPLSIEQAKSEAEDQLGIERYEQLFGKIEE